MNLKSIVLAGAALLSLAAPAAALADPRWGHDRGNHEGWRDGDEGRRHEWREHERWRGGDEWRGHERWEDRGYAYGLTPRCFIENRGYYSWSGDYVYRPVRVCR